MASDLDRAKVALVDALIKERSPRYHAIVSRIYAQGYTTTAGMLTGIATTMTALEMDDLATRLEREWVTRWQLPA